MQDELQTRTTEEVFADHLRLAQAGRVEEDLARNYAEDCVFLTNRGVYHGREGGRQLAEMLLLELPDPTFIYTTQQVSGRVAFLGWSGRGGGRRVRDGADSFLIEEGRIRVQTIHYTVEAAE